MTIKNIVSMTGLKGSGKDTFAKKFTENGYENVKLSGALKVMLRSFFEYCGESREDIDRWLEGSTQDREEPIACLGGKSARHAMQTLGTEWGRECIDGDIWIRATEARIGALDKAIITDMRFPNEAELCAEIGAHRIRVERPSRRSNVDLHESESHIQGLEVDDVVINDGTIEDLENKAERLMEELENGNKT